MNPEDFNNDNAGAVSAGSSEAPADVPEAGDTTAATDSPVPEAGGTAAADSDSVPEAGGAPDGAAVKKSRKPLIIGIAACAVVVIALLAVFIPRLLISDKAKVEKGFRLLSADLDDASLPSLSDYLGFSQLKEQAAVSAELNLNLEKLPGDSIPVPQLEGTGIQYLIQEDPAAKNMRLKANIKFGTLFSTGAIATWKDDRLYVEAPDFFEGSLAMDTKNIKEQVDNSMFAGSINVPDDFTLDIFSGNEATEQELMKNFTENLILKNKPAWIQVWTEAEVSKTKEKKDVQAGTQTLPAREYKITLPKEEYLAALGQFKSFLTEDESSRAFFSWLMKQSSLYSMSMSGYGNAPSPDEMDIQAALVDAVDSYIESVSSSEKEMDIYVLLLKDGRVASFNAADMPGSEPGDTFSFDVSMSGETRLCDSSKITLTGSDSPSPVNISWNRTAGETDLSSAASIDFTDGESGSPYNITLSGNFDTADGSYELAVSMDDGEGPITLNAQGSFADVTPGESYTLYMDSLTLSYQEEAFEFSGDYHQEPLNGPVEDPAPVSHELFQMTDEDLTGLIYEIYQNASGLLPLFS